MTGASTGASRRRNAYDLFILVLTILSLVIMGIQFLLPISEDTSTLLTVYDNGICVIFLLDFAWNLSQSHPRRTYFIRQRGWLDLIGSIPSFGFLRFTQLLRLARLSRLARIARLLSGQRRQELMDDVIRNRSQYAVYITLIAAMIVLVTASVLVLQFESRAPDANITTGGDALWWAIVTITTVGYGDKFPVTFLGRTTAVFVMFAGVGIIGALASILASVLVSSPEPSEPEPADSTGPVAAPAGAPVTPSVEQELASLRTELAALRRTLSGAPGDPPAT
jgi:voltage-gated potassium channel